MNNISKLKNKDWFVPKDKEKNQFSEKGLIINDDDQDWGSAGMNDIQENSEYNIKADIVIKSLGFDPENLPELFSTKELSVSRWGTIKIDLNTMQTNIDGVFAAGDIVRGASLVVWAIKDGRDAATQIQKYLKENNNEKEKTIAA